MQTAIETDSTTSQAKEAGVSAPTVPNRWRHMAILTAANSLDNSESSVLPTLFPVIKASLELSLSSLGMLLACSRIAGALFSPFWLWLARRWNRKGVLVVCTGAWGAWGIAAGFSHNFAMLLTCYSILAIGTAGGSALITAILADLFDDVARGRAVGFMFGATALVSAIVGPALGHLADLGDGWRIGFWLIGGVNILTGIVILIWFRDPGIGASETHSAPRAAHDIVVTWHAALSIFRIPTFNLILISRVLAGQLLIIPFGVVFLTQVHGFSNKTAAVVVAPSGVGYLLGTIGGAIVFDRLHKRWPRLGRVSFLQTTQLAFGVVAYFGTQFHWGSIYAFCGFFFLMGLILGTIPGANRPIVMAVVPPQMRGWAFTILIAIVESLAWAAYNAGAGWFGDRYGLSNVFLVVLVGFVFFNGMLMTLLYWTYPRDVARIRETLTGKQT